MFFLVYKIERPIVVISVTGLIFSRLLSFFDWYYNSRALVNNVAEWLVGCQHRGDRGSTTTAYIRHPEGHLHSFEVREEHPKDYQVYEDGKRFVFVVIVRLLLVGCCGKICKGRT